MNRVPVIGPSLIGEGREGIHFEARLINGDYNWQLNACQGYEKCERSLSRSCGNDSKENEFGGWFVIVRVTEWRN